MFIGILFKNQNDLPSKEIEEHDIAVIELSEHKIKIKIVSESSKFSRLIKIAKTEFSPCKQNNTLNITIKIGPIIVFIRYAGVVTNEENSFLRSKFKDDVLFLNFNSLVFEAYFEKVFPKLIAYKHKPIANKISGTKTIINELSKQVLNRKSKIKLLTGLSAIKEFKPALVTEPYPYCFIVINKNTDIKTTIAKSDLITEENFVLLNSLLIKNSKTHETPTLKNGSNNTIKIPSNSTVIEKVSNIK